MVSDAVLGAEFGPEYLLVFIGYSEDGKALAQAIADLEQDIQVALDKYRRVNPTIPFNRVKFWKWNSDAPATSGGQEFNTHPNLKRADIAVFVFNERIGEVAWQELDFSRKRRPRIAVMPFFPSSPPGGDKLMQEEGSLNWANLLAKKRSLSSGWTEPDNDAVTPLPQYNNIEDLRRISYERLELELVRITSKFASKINDVSDLGGGKGQPDTNTLYLGEKIENATQSNGDLGEGVDFNLDTHAGNILSIAPSDINRYNATFGTTLRKFNGPSLIIDPTGEIYKYTATEREKFGPVIKLDPWSIVTDARVDGLNPLDVIDALGMSPVDGAHFIADIITPYSVFHARRLDRDVTDPYWTNMQRKLAVGLILLVKGESQSNDGAFSNIRNMLNSDDVVYNLAVKLDNDKDKLIDPVAVQEISSFLQLADAARSGVLSGLNQFFSAFSSRIAQRSSETSTFDVRLWTNRDPVTIYIIGPAPGIESFDIIYRMWLSVLFYSIFQQQHLNSRESLIIVDINESFRRWPGLRSAITHSRTSRVWLQISDMSDLESAFDSQSAILNSFSILQALKPNNFRAATALSEVFGMPAEVIFKMKASEVLIMSSGREAQILRRLDN